MAPVYDPVLANAPVFTDLRDRYVRELQDCHSILEAGGGIGSTCWTAMRRCFAIPGAAPTRWRTCSITPRPSQEVEKMLLALGFSEIEKVEQAYAGINFYLVARK